MRDETKIQLPLDNSKECRNSSFYSASLFSTLNQSFATKTVDQLQQEIQSCIGVLKSSLYKDCPENTSAGYVMPVLDVTPECDETEWYRRQDYINKRQPQNRMSEHQKMERIENALKEASSLCEFKAYLDRKSDFDKDMANGRKYATTFTENVHLVNQALNVNWDKLRAGIPQKYFTPLCHNSGAIALGRQTAIPVIPILVQAWLLAALLQTTCAFPSDSTAILSSESSGIDPAEIADSPATPIMRWYCGASGFDRHLSHQLSEDSCPHRMYEANLCCLAHDLCYVEDGKTREECDAAFCFCLKRTLVETAQSNHSRSGCFNVADSFCQIMQIFGSAAHSQAKGGQAMSYSTPPPYSSTTSNQFQATPEPTKRPLNGGNDTIFDGLNYSATSVINRDNSTPPSLGEFVIRALEVLKNNESIKNTGTVLGENRWKLWDKLNVQDHFYSMEVWDDRYSDYIYAFDGVTPTLLRPVKDGAKYRIRFGKAVLLKW
ncbi:phospholipase A2-like protein Y52B11A.8 [Ditylenchus destructor]|uniref:Phospholipase A2-like protein Y52B11A.8 n=1 Tax=Ditylenchus destructor TaxID=166010 RepID=A0AAD4R1Q7_9BILA|nr:phospholipase A2-like protein Y52B11A.8 [Ditylenchus destructor]